MRVVILFLVLAFHLPAKIIVVNGLTQHLTTVMGGVQKGKIVLKNIGNEAASARIFLEDYAYYVEGDSSPATSQRSNKSWIRLKDNLVTLQPDEEKAVEFEITVPRDKRLNGSYWSVAMVEPADDLVNPEAKAGEVSIRTVVRYAIQLISHIKTKTTTKSELSFLNAEVKKTANRKDLIIDVKNTGLIFHKAKLVVEFYDANTGEEKQVITSRSLSLLPTLSKTYRLDIGQVPKGDYKVVVLANCENEEIFGLNMDISITSD